jgi:Zn-dependent metalloprotease
VLETPVLCSGMDEEGATVSFWGRRDTDEFQLSDPLRRIRTYDLEFADLQTDPPLPSEPIVGPDSEFEDDHRAGVSAHFNATRVLDFYKSILQRNGIDDAGMVLISLVNCTYAKQPGSVELKNAFWSDKKMWYGQVRQGDRLVSLSRCLDVIAHELTHGVVESTSGLVYKNQSGALNESFADIFGIMVKNWYLADKADVGTWNWELGSGLGRDGLPLRDMKDPQRIGYPAHMDDFDPTQRDDGGVHINSNIHNKAAYNVLTCTDNGARVFSPEDAAVLFYLGMARLQPLAKFTDARQAVIDVALTYYAGHPDQKKKLDALQDAYADVGIA